jgi:hypothetical protein
MAFGFLKSLDLFQIHPNLYMPQTNSKTGRTLYTKKFSSLWGFMLTILYLVIVLGFLIDKLFKMNSGNLDTLNVNYLPYDYDGEKIYIG